MIYEQNQFLYIDYDNTLERDLVESFIGDNLNDFWLAFTCPINVVSTANTLMWNNVKHAPKPMLHHFADDYAVGCLITILKLRKSEWTEEIRDLRFKNLELDLLSLVSGADDDPEYRHKKEWIGLHLSQYDKEERKELYSHHYDKWMWDSADSIQRLYYESAKQFYESPYAEWSYNRNAELYYQKHFSEGTTHD